MIVGIAATALSISASVVYRDRLNRIAPWAWRGSIFIAFRTWLGSRLPLAARRPGGSTYSLLAEQQQDSIGLDGRKADIGSVGQAIRRITIHESIRWLESIPLSRRFSQFGHACICDISFPASSAAFPIPTIPATFSVPPRRSLSCGPPITSGRNAASRDVETGRRLPLVRGTCGP